MAAEENAGIDTAITVAAEQRASAIAREQMAKVPYAHGLETVSIKSTVYKSYQATIFHGDRIQRALDRIEQATTERQLTKATQSLRAARTAYDKAMQAYAKAQITEYPEEWNQGMVEHVRKGAEGMAKDLYQGKRLDEAVQSIKSSVWSTDFVRLFGEEKYAALVNDAIKWWHQMAQDGAYPLWTHKVDPTVYRHILEPSLGSVDKPRTPPAFQKRETGLYFGDTIFDVAVSLTASQMEVMRQQFAARYINDFILPHTLDKASKTKEYIDALTATHLKSPNAVLASASQLVKENFEDFNPGDYGLRKSHFGHQLDNAVLIDKDMAKTLHAMMDQTSFKQIGGHWIMRGTSLYKFSVLTGPRHLAHVGFGGMAFMMLREPLAPLQFLKAARILKGTASAEDHGLAHGMLSGLKQKVYQIGPHHTWQAQGIGPHYAWNHAAGDRIGEDLATDYIHQAKQKGVAAAEFIPNKLAQLEETIIAMYKVSTYLSAKGRGLAHDAALETAHKVFVDVNGMSLMERTAIKQIFPFYAFTRHLFRYLFTYPVDYPLRASIISQFAEGEQADWNSGLPRSYMSLLWLGQPDKNGNIAAVDLKNTNPFRSFANDFSFAGFFSSLSPFLTGPLAAIGVDTLSGTTQLYPGTTYNPQTGSLQATPPPGGLISLAESFVPQVGLLDHFLQLTNSTRMLARFSPLSYRKQLYNMLNVPFVPEVINVPYQQEITEMRRFRAAQAAVALVEKNPSAQNIAKMMEWNTVPFNNELIPPSILGAYYKRIQQALVAAGKGYIAPKAVVLPPPRRPAVLKNF